MKNINRNSFFWTTVEFFWLFIALFSVLTSLCELVKIKEQIDYKNKQEFQIIIEYRDIQSYIFGQTFTLKIDDNMTQDMRESIYWFYTINDLLDNGYKSEKWKKFISYTRGFVFKEKGYISHIPQHNKIYFGWPKNLDFNIEKIQLKDEIREITNRLIKLEDLIREYEKYEPDTSPLFRLKYLYFTLFFIAFLLKICKLRYVDYSRLNKNCT